jgi:hypothetical protein
MEGGADSAAYGYYRGCRKLRKDGAPASFPYGFGLSYTSFALSDPAFAASAASRSEPGAGPHRPFDNIALYISVD